MLCPCCSNLPYTTCCAPLHQGQAATTAEQLMRSRYAGFVRRDIPYLVRTSHPMLRARLTPKDFKRTFDLGWTGLQIVAVEAGGVDDTTGMVHFRATHQRGVHEERSQFVRIAGEWLYREGKVS
jgi:SEC-C motif-containing protein